MDEEYRPEKHLITCRIDQAPEGVQLPRQRPVLRMMVTNLRNRPLPAQNFDTLTSSVLGLYKNLMTGSKEFPLLYFHGELDTRRLHTPFRGSPQENAAPSPLSRAPAGLIPPPASPSSPLRSLLLPPHPEKASHTELKADRRNCVRVMFCNRGVVFRAVAPVYRPDGTELPNRWRISDYDTEGNMLMSVLCQFKLTPQEQEAHSAKRKKSEDESSSSTSPAKKRLRL